MIGRTINPWWTVVAGSLGSALGAGTIMVYAYGILAVGMAGEFGWSREIVAANMTAFLIGSGLGTIILGSLIARFGIRLPAAVFAATFGALFAAVTVVPPQPLLFQLMFLVVGIGGAACTAMPYSVAISGFFDARRGLALGIVVAGSGFGATIFPLVAQAIVDDAGWRAGFTTIGLTAAIVSVFGLVFLVRTPPEAVKARGTAGDRDNGRPFSRMIVRNRDFWLIAIPILGVSIATFGAMATMVPFLRDQRISPSAVAGILSFAGLASWVGRLVVGYLLDQIFAPYLSAAIFLLAASGILLLVTTQSLPYAYAGAALVGIAMGSEADLVTFLVSRYFKLVEFSRALGIMWVMWAWGGSVGTAIAGQSFALTQSYAAAYTGFAALLLVSAGLITRLQRYHNGETETPPTIIVEKALAPSSLPGSL